MICSDDPGYLLSKAARLSKGKINKRLGEIGLTFPQFIVIMHLQGSPHDAAAHTPAAIAEHLKYDRPTITGIIDRLVKQGFVSRKTNPADRRSQTISLTEKAGDLIQKMNIFFKEVNDLTLSGFNPTEVEELKGFLLRIIANLDERQDALDKCR